MEKASLSGIASSLEGRAKRKDAEENKTVGVNMKLGSQIKKIRKVIPEKFEISLQFTDGLKATVNLNFLFNSSQRKPLILEIKRGALFGKCFVESGALAWPNGYELCPDAIRMWISEQKKNKSLRGSSKGS